MPNESDIRNLENRLKNALLRASRNATRQITEEFDVTVPEEELERSEPALQIDANEKSRALTAEITVLLLDRIEKLESKVDELEDRITTAGTGTGVGGTTP